jgi:hypothetical protein
MFPFSQDLSRYLTLCLLFVTPPDEISSLYCRPSPSHSLTPMAKSGSVNLAARPIYELASGVHRKSSDILSIPDSLEVKSKLGISANIVMCASGNGEVHFLISHMVMMQKYPPTPTDGHLCIGVVWKGSAKVVLQPPAATAWDCEPQQTVLLHALTLRGPSGGHCVELQRGAKMSKSSPHAGPPSEAQRVRLFFTQKRHAVTPGGHHGKESR